jgi:hypothetical protein
VRFCLVARRGFATLARMKSTLIRAFVPVLAAALLCGCPEKQGEGKEPATPVAEQGPETQPLPEPGDPETTPPAEDQQQQQEQEPAGATGGGW